MDNVKIVKLLNPLERKNPTVKLLNAKKYFKYHRNWTGPITLMNVLL